MSGRHPWPPPARGNTHTQLGRPPRVYLAGPITSDPQGNLRKGIRLYDVLCDLGFDPYLPHFNILCRHRPYEEWMAQDFRWLDVCDGLLRWGGVSPGADREWAHAEARRMPRFRTMGDLLGWARSDIEWVEYPYTVSMRGWRGAPEA